MNTCRASIGASVPYQKWWALLGLSLLSFTAFLDFTIISTALPFIQHDLHARIAQLQWVTNIYGMVLCMVMILFGKLGDRFGRRKCFYLGFILFVIAIIGAGLSNNIQQLIAFRAVQGLAAGAIFTLGMALLPQAFPEAQQTQAIGIFSAFNGLGLAIGPFLGGVLLHYGNWRWIFFINLPIIALGFIGCLVGRLQESSKQSDTVIDWLGFGLLAMGLGSLIYGLINSETQGWNSLSLAFIVIGFILLSLLLAVERSVSQPLLDFSIFHTQKALLAVISCIVGGFVTFVLLFFDPLYLHHVRKETAMTVGLMLLIIPLVQVVISLFLSHLLKWMRITTLLLLGVMATLLATILHTQFHAQSHVVVIVLAFVLMGYSWGIANAGSVTALMQSVAAEKIGGAIGTVFTVFNVAGAIFLALAATIFHTSQSMAASTTAGFLAGFHAVAWIGTVLLLGLLSLSVLIFFKLKSQND